MANEIQIAASLSANKNGASISGSGSIQFDLTGTEMTSLVQTTANAAALVNVGGVDQLEAVFLKNLDAAINITIYSDGASGAVPICVLKPGKFSLIAGCSGTLGCKSASGTPDLLVAVVET